MGRPRRRGRRRALGSRGITMGIRRPRATRGRERRLGGCMPEHALDVEGLGKLYRLFARPRHRVLETLTLGRWRLSTEHWALRGLDLAVRPGAVLGICGENGAGKSTLLKILAGTTS